MWDVFLFLLVTAASSRQESPGERVGIIKKKCSVYDNNF